MFYYFPNQEKIPSQIFYNIDILNLIKTFVMFFLQSPTFITIKYER